MPYRLHLSAHVLKETMMIFFFSLCFLRIHYLYKILPIIFIFYLRKFSLIYFLIFFNLNKIFNYFQINIILKLIILLFLLIVGLDIINELFIFHYESNLIEQVTAWSQKNMGGRDYDNITNFKYYHAYGVLLKAFIWPILFLSGSFVFFSFNFYFLILAVEIIVINILFYKKYKKLLISAEIYIVLFFISFHVSTFTAYFRYSYIAFILIIFYKLYYLENEKKINNLGIIGIRGLPPRYGAFDQHTDNLISYSNKINDNKIYYVLCDKFFINSYYQYKNCVRIFQKEEVVSF